MLFPFAQYKTTIALAMTAAFSLSTFNLQAQTAVTGVSEKVVGDGLYEMVYLPEAKALYVASAQGFKDVNGGALYRLDPATLKKTGETFTDYKNFGMTMDPDGKVFYTTNTLDGGVSKVDAESGKVLQRLMFEGKDKDGDPVGAREIFWHNGMLFIGGVADPGFISVVDASTMTLKHRIENAGKWVTGIIYSPVTQRIYAANGGGEILTINPETYKIEQRWTPGDGKTYLFLNMAEDAKTGRLFVTDDSKAKVTLVIDERTGKVLKRIEGDALGIKFNDKRNEIYISQRESKKVLQLDATTYAVKHSWSFDSHPNSLLISPDGQSLYVTVKQEFNEDNTTKGPDSVVRIALN
ncbi:YncE family protein [Scandinavium hiltneri]|uniref:YncE family protein n=1 Tax=Scandinavium hiltneri TaxID=2926519 RepID=UPI0035B0CF50